MNESVKIIEKYFDLGIVTNIARNIMLSPRVFVPNRITLFYRNLSAVRFQEALCSSLWCSHHKMGTTSNLISKDLFCEINKNSGID